MSTATHHDDAPLGAYGTRLHGLDGAADLLVPVDPAAPAYAVATEIGRAPSENEFVDADRAELRLRSGGQIVVDGARRRIVFRVPHAVRPDEIVHPYLAPAAAVLARWAGRESFHAGAFVAGGKAWGVVGEREAGKSSTLAWLAAAGGEIVCDDMLVLDGDRTLPGPRSLDLRADAAERLGVGEAIGMTGARERWRLRLGPVAEGLRLAGWVFLAWGERLEVRTLAGPERFERLALQQGLRLPPVRPEALFELSALPAFELRRPASWDSLAGSADRLLELAAG
jgi:hypothetical protein